MSQLLFDALSGGMTTIDSPTVLTVQSLLDPQNILNSPDSGMTITPDDEDVFQCGRCKKQFSSLSQFMSHKKEHCSVGSSGNATTIVSQNSCLSQSAQTPGSLSRQLNQMQIPGSPGLAAITSGVVLNEADLLSFTSTMEQGVGTASTTPTATSSSTQNSFLSQFVSSARNVMYDHHVVSSETQIQQDNGAVQTQGQAVGLSLLTNTLVPTRLIVTSQSNSSYTTYSSNMIMGNIQADKSLNIGTSGDSKHTFSPRKIAPNTASLLTEVTGGTSTCLQKNNDEKDELGQRTSGPVHIVPDLKGSVVRSRKRGGGVNCSNSESGNKQSRKLRCPYCSKEFTKNFDMQQHIRCHTGVKPFQCIVCGRAFAQKSNVKKHMQTHKVWPDGLAHTLPKQPLGENSSSNIEIDTKSDGAEADKSDSEKTQTIDNRYVCSYCNFSSKTYYELKSHMTQHKEEKVYKCILKSCNMTFQDLEAFVEHTRMHENELTYRCHLCNKHFQSLYDLGVHQYSHSLYPNQGPRVTSRYFRCTLCLNKYATPAALEHHMATSSHKYSCHYCNKVFPCERYLRRHLLTHSSNDMHLCSVCNKGFKTEYYLRVHSLIHTGEKPFQCHCGASFNRKDRLKRHKLIHEAVKKYKCPFRMVAGCPREFNRPDKLKAHILTHSGIKPYTCKVCERGFRRKATLVDHERLHQEGQAYPYFCNQCEKGFAQENELQSHKCTGQPTSKGKSQKLSKQANYRRLRSNRRRRGSFEKSTSSVETRRQERTSKSLVENQSSAQDAEELPNADDGDDIPTAHIEIITTGDFGVSASTGYSQLSLYPVQISSNLTLQPVVTYPSSSERNIQAPESAVNTLSDASQKTNSALPVSYLETKVVGDQGAPHIIGCFTLPLEDQQHELNKHC
ncbi:zinc finger protein 341-like isoform X1 [Tachypleus tridentatus]|uniref:zinc finger protein 341-like isoform X1 n=2 Tax=Tachypleus tridentatus TaxID=6853 RepID=UPI003FD424DB